MQLQGSGNRHLENVADIFILQDKLDVSVCNLQLWIFAKLAFDTFTESIPENIKCRLQMLVDEFIRY